MARNKKQKTAEIIFNITGYRHFRLDNICTKIGTELNSTRALLNKEPNVIRVRKGVYCFKKYDKKLITSYINDIEELLFQLKLAL